MLETMNCDADINSDLAADSRPAEKTLPTPLPTISDGELDFEPIESAERFEPLWITPTSETRLEASTAGPAMPFEAMRPRPLPRSATTSN